MYQITIPLFIRGLANLSAILDKASLSAQERNFNVQNLLAARLAPDMFNLIQQVQYAYYHALDLAEKVAGRKELKLSYKETTIGELKNNIAQVIDFLKTVAPEEMNDGEEKMIVRYDDKTKQTPAFEYATTTSLPNFYFHLTTAYDILRHNGVPLKKTDYLG